MDIPCPHKKMKLFVNVFDEVCDAADMCKFPGCQFFDMSEEATKRFINASCYYGTIEGIMEAKRNPNVQLQRRPLVLYENKHTPEIVH